MRRIVLLWLLAAALMVAVAMGGAFAVSAQDNDQGIYPDRQDVGQGDDNSQPQGGPTADNQSQGPPCGHDWCDWYQVCRWEFWGWNPRDGWTLIHTDGYCDTSG